MAGRYASPSPSFNTPKQRYYGISKCLGYGLGEPEMTFDTFLPTAPKVFLRRRESFFATSQTLHGM